MKSFPKKYSGKYLALINNKIVATGNSQLEVYRVAKSKYPAGMVSLKYIPTKRETLTFL